ncbi:MAG TPA: SPASM domain-containing protein [Candidatus Obscuribacterales bacterium]|nr:SPASM domain-containing protein [Candidatus Obscuribacterales bacterium]
MNELNISYGISLDGTPEVNDANRVDHQGKGSYHRVKAALDLIKSDPNFELRMNGILSVINIHSDPIEIYRHFRSLGLRAIDLRLPDATHDIPPPGVDVNGTNTPYADWLIPIFDEWFAEADTEFNVRLFQYIIGLIFGSQKSTVDVGAISSNFAVIETDGGIEPSGALKACYEGITKVGLNVLSNEIEEIFDIPVVALFSTAENELPDTCKKCPIVSVCGGGKPPHRYSSANGFNNPSVYCRDLMKLIVHIQEKVVAELPEEVKSKMNLAPLKELVVAD